MAKTNTFRFISFHERLANVHVDVVRRRHRFPKLSQDDDQSFFYEALEKWSDLDGSQHYDDFKSDIPSKADLCRYAQILHHQKAISEALRRHLAVDGSLCSTALLELTIAFCCDLQRDFYEQDHFWPFFDAILSLLTPSTKETSPELLENVFSALAHLLKLCWAPMSKRLPEVYDRFRPLLNHRRSHLRRFSSEALSFLVRKTSNFDEFLRFSLRDDDQNLAELLFEAMRGTPGTFHSKAGAILAATLEALEDGNLATTAFEMSEALHPILAKHAQGELAKPLLVDVLLERTLSIFQRSRQGGGASDDHGGKTKETADIVVVLERHIRLLSIWRINCKGETFFDLCLPNVIRDLIVPIMEENIVDDRGSQEFYSALLTLASSIFGHRRVVDEYRREFEKFTTKIFDRSFDQAISIDLRTLYMTTLAKSDGCGIAFELVCLPIFGDFVERILSIGSDQAAIDESIFDAILAGYCRILTIKRWSDGDFYDLYPGKKFRNFRDMLAKKISSIDRVAKSETSKVACAIAVFGIVIEKDADEYGREILDAFLAKVVENPANFGRLILYAAVTTLLRIGKESPEVVANTLPPKKWMEIFERGDNDDGLVWMLRAADRYFEAIGRMRRINFDQGGADEAYSDLQVSIQESTEIVKSRKHKNVEKDEVKRSKRVKTTRK